jgi:hypothetical protein
LENREEDLRITLIRLLGRQGCGDREWMELVRCCVQWQTLVLTVSTF